MKDEYKISIQEIERLKKNIGGETFTMPQGLTRAQKRRYIIDCANGKIKPDEKKTKKMIYQMIVNALKQMQEQGTDIGSAIKYCSENAFSLVQLYEQNTSLDEILDICLENK